MRRGTTVGAKPCRIEQLSQGAPAGGGGGGPLSTGLWFSTIRAGEGQRPNSFTQEGTAGQLPPLPGRGLLAVVPGGTMLFSAALCDLSGAWLSGLSSSPFEKGELP